jgi:hypothetical protein
VWSDGAGIQSIDLVTDWSGRGFDHGVRKKVPSRITYEDDGSWGFGIKPSDFAYAWTKLLLDTEKLTDFDDATLKDFDPGLLALPPNKSAEDVVTDYLRYLYHYTMQELERKRTGTKAALDITSIHFWFTMPAIWSVEAQMATRSAALRAGFGSRHGDTISMIREPEAAAIACLNELIVDSPSSLVEEGQGVLVCDCGGGTVVCPRQAYKMSPTRLTKFPSGSGIL